MKKRDFCVHPYSQQVSTVHALCSGASVLLFFKLSLPTQVKNNGVFGRGCCGLCLD